MHNFGCLENMAENGRINQAADEEETDLGMIKIQNAKNK